MSPKELLTREFLEEQFIRLEKSENRIAEEFNLSSPYAVRYYLLKYELSRPRIHSSRSILTKEFLEEHYVILGKSTRTIKKETGYCRGTIQRALRDYGIPTRRRCDVVNSRQWIQNTPSKLQDYEEIPKRYWSGVLKGAKQRRLDFTVTQEYCWGLFIKQDRKCALSGVPIKFRKSREESCETTASLDRIDSSKGYVEGNVQWLHKDVNKMKWDLPQDLMISYCIKIAEYWRGLDAGDISAK